MDLSPVANRAESQESYVSSVQLSPNRVNKEYDHSMLDVFPVFPVSPRTDSYVSPVLIPDSPAAPTLGSLLNEATGSYGSIIRIPATSLSITDQAEHLHLPVVVLPNTDPERGPAPEVVPPSAAFA